MGNLSGASLQGLRGSGVQILDISGCKGVTAAMVATLKGAQLTDLNISHCRVLDMDSCIQKLCDLGLPLKKLNISNTNVGDECLGELRKLPLLRTLIFKNFDHYELGSISFEVIRGLPLTSLALGAASLAGDWDAYLFQLDFLSILKGMQLSKLSLNCRDSYLKDEGLAGLAGMPLVNFSLTHCSGLTDAGFANLRGMPLETLCLDAAGGCHFTVASWEILRGMPLRSLQLSRQLCIDDATLEVLHGLPLEHLHLIGYIDYASRITDVGFSYFAGMPLTSLSVYAQISDEGVAHLRGLPLMHLELLGCQPISDQGIAALEGMHLVELCLSNVSLVTDVGFRVLRGMPLSSLILKKCSLMTDVSFDLFKDLPLTDLALLGCSRVMDRGLASLSRSHITSLLLTGCELLSWVGLRNLEGLPLDFLHIGIGFGDPNDDLNERDDWPSHSAQVWNIGNRSSEHVWNLEHLREAITGLNWMKWDDVDADLW